MPALTGWHYVILCYENYFAVSAGFAAGVVAGLAGASLTIAGAAF